MVALARRRVSPGSAGQNPTGARPTQTPTGVTPAPTSTGVPSSAGICPSGTVRCGNTCMNTNTGPHNCGSCGNVCQNGTSCVNGSCQLACSGTNWGGSCGDTNTDPHNCGSCGTV